MNYFQILATTCSSDISSCCSDYGIAMYLFVVKKAIMLIQIAVPIVLLVMVTVQFTKMMINPDDKKSIVVLKNKFFAAVIIFLLPYLVNLIINLVPDTFEIAGCWQAADDTVTVMNETEEYVANKTTYTNNVSYSDIKSSSKSDTKSSKKSNSSNSSSSSTKSGKKVVKYAKKFVGNRYVWGGTSLTNGTDCSGFTMRVYEHFGISLPRTSSSQSSVGKKVSSLSSAQAGDLVFYGSSGNVSHVAIYISNGKIVHASNSKAYPAGGIKTSTANYRTPITIRRVL